MWHGWGMGGGGMLAGFLLMLILLGGLVVLVGLVIWAIVRSGGQRSLRGPVAPEREDALELARRRYARGEITREEYLRIREDLTS